MKILIVETPRIQTIEHYNDVANAPLSASLNCGYALAVSRRAGWDACFLDLSGSMENEQNHADAILAEDADIVLLHWVYTWGGEASVRNMLIQLKKDGCAVIGAFGLFPTLSGDRLIDYAPQLDFIITGEFEWPLAELLDDFRNRRDLSAVPGLLIRGTPFTPRKVQDDLSLLPIPDETGTNCSYPVMNIAASRGCFGDCAFCFIHGYYGCSRRRERCVAAIETEIESRLQRRRIDQLYFVDPTFIGYGAGQKKRIAEISIIAKSAGMPFGFETRVDTLNPELVSLLGSNGASSIFLGIESGCDSVLRRINKRITTRQIEAAVRSVRETGIQLNIGFIMFEPDSTMAELIENFDFLEKLGLLSNHELTANLLYHSQIILYGSKAWRRLEKESRLLPDENLPFEAACRFKDADVELVCSTMRRMATEYFTGMDRCRREGSVVIDADAVNGILKEGFLSALRHARSCSRLDYGRREERFLVELRKIFQLRNYGG